MSQRHAAQLGLDLEYFHDIDHENTEEDDDHLAENEDTEIEFGHGGIQLAIGTVMFNKKKGRSPAHLTPREVTCLVC
jgi:hypothetical protein